MWLVFVILSILIVYRFSKFEASVIAFVLWLLLALLMFVDARPPYEFTGYVKRVAEITRENPIVGALVIFANNAFVALMIRLLGPIYAGLVIFNTAQAARELCHCYPLRLLIMPHTLLELYSYALAMKGRLKKALKILMIAAAIEAFAVKL